MGNDSGDLLRAMIMGVKQPTIFVTVLNPCLSMGRSAAQADDLLARVPGMGVFMFCISTRLLYFTGKPTG